jgi:HK97 gp10 family phage protein
MKQLINIALKVENEAKRRCPVATGYLRNSIAAGWDRKKSWVNVSANYGAYVEYGTYKMRAQPYLRPAIDKVKRELRR